jgi:hypothetical protein
MSSYLIMALFRPKHIVTLNNYIYCVNNGLYVTLFDVATGGIN